MRRLLALAVLVALAGALIARRWRRARQASSPPRPTSPPPAGAPRFASVPWTLVDAPAERPRLTLRCRQDDRFVLDRVDAQETPTQVFVTALARHEPRSGDEPPREPAVVTVALSGPLGDRELIPAPVDGEPDAPPD